MKDQHHQQNIRLAQIIRKVRKAGELTPVELNILADAAEAYLTTRAKITHPGRPGPDPRKETKPL